MDITDSQWAFIKDCFPTKIPGTRGRPPQPARAVLNGVLWVCRTGAAWMDMPARYPPYQTCHRRFQRWNEEGVWDKVLNKLAIHLKNEGQIDITECFIDGTFSSAKKGAIVSEKLSVVKAPRSWPSQTLLVFLSPYGPQQPIPMKKRLYTKPLNAHSIK